MKFKKAIEVEAGISDGDPLFPLGQSGYLLSSDGSNVSWVSPGGLSAETAEAIVQPIKANEALTKGDPLYIVGYQLGQDVNIVAKADSSDVAKMPVVGLADDDYSNQTFGTMTAFGSFNGAFDTSGGTEGWSVGDIIFVKPLGGLTNIKPGGTDLIQNVAIVSRVSTQTGELEVIALGRTNDVPNLPEGRLFVGTAANTSLTSDVVYVDDTNDRVGINTATPIYDLDVDGTVRASGGFIDNEDNSALRVVSPPGGSFRSSSTIVGAIEVTIPNSYVKNNVTFTLEVREASFAAYTIKIAMAGSVGIDLFPTLVSAYLTSDSDINNNCTIKYDTAVPEFDDVKIYIEHPLGNFVTNTGVFITEFTVPATIATGNLAWGLDITSVPAAANGTFPNIQVTNWKRNGQDVYYGSGTGNVGIGTTSPSEKLVVRNGTSNTDVKILAYNSAAGTEATLKFSTIASETNYEKAAIIARNAAGSFGRNDMHFALDSAADSGNVQFSDTKMTILNNGNVGIGTTSPPSKLSVSGGTLSVSGSGAGFGVVKLGDPTDSNPYVGIYRSAAAAIATSGNFLNLGGYDGIAFTTGAAQLSGQSERMRILSNGNVGIGTTSPSELLHLSSTGPARLLIEADTDNITETDNAQIILKQDGGAVVGNLGYKTNTNGLEIINQYAAADGILAFGTSNLERMRISDLGDVGIGTTNPGAKLDVAGNIIVSGGVSNENDGVRVTNPGGASYISAGNVAGAIKITLPQIGINTMMRMEVKVYEYTTNESFTVQCGGYSAGTSQWFNEYAYIESSAKDDRNFTVRFGYDGSKSCIYIGELGSNWTYPQVFVTEFQGGFQNATALNYQDGWDISFEASAFQGVVKTQADTQINNWARSGTNTYYASSTGGVGIGTTSPSTSLTLGTGSSGISFQSSSTTLNSGKIAVIKQIELGNGNGNLTFETYQGGSGGGERMRILNNGNVGIGTTSPYSKLQVASAAGSDVPTAGTATGGLWVSNSNKSYGINMGVSASGWGFIQSQRADGLTNLYSLNLQPLGGNVGIGTTSPGKLLEVSGGANEACLRLRDTASNYWDIQNTTNGKLDFSRGGTFRMRIDQNGSLSLVSSTALKGGGGSWGTYSDERVKKDVSNYTKGLNEILAIKPITYKYNGKANLTSEKQFVGIIAQEIKEVLPSTVEVTPTKLNDEDEFDTDLLTFDASELTFTLINAVKDLKAEIEELKKQINK